MGMLYQNNFANIDWGGKFSFTNLKGQKRFIKRKNGFCVLLDDKSNQLLVIPISFDRMEEANHLYVHEKKPIVQSIPELVRNQHLLSCILYR